LLVKPYTTNFSKIGEQVFLRCDPKYRHFWDSMNGVSIDEKRLVQLQTKDILLPFSKKVIKKGKLDEERPIIELEDVEPRTSIILNERLVSEVGSDKLDFGDCDLVLNRLEPYLGKVIINDRSRKYIGTTEWIPLKVDTTKVRPLFLKYLLLLPQFRHSFWLLRSGKRHARLALVDFRNMLIPLPALGKQMELESEIIPLEKEIQLEHRSLPKPIDIVNDVFSRQFRYSVNDYQKRAKQNSFQRPASSLGATLLLRSSVKFQHPKYDYVNDILSHYPIVKLGSLCSRRIQRGVQPTYVPGGEVLVVKTLNLRNEYLDLTEADHVTRGFFETNNECELKRNDILVSSTGEGRGKVDIYGSDEPAIADSHISIIRLKGDVNPYYVLYFMRSLLGKLQLETLELAIKGTPEIYWHQLERLRLIDLPKEEQEAIVERVGTRLEDLRNRRSILSKLRDQIDSVVKEAFIHN